DRAGKTRACLTAGPNQPEHKKTDTPRVPRTNEVTFKVLLEDAGRQYLRPINPQYPIIDIIEETHICGKVMGSFIPE
ncbi:S24 family peptidase, partial [Pseudomonas sp. BDAL1]